MSKNKILPFDKSMLPELSELLSNYKFKEYSYYQEINNHQLTEYAIEKIKSKASNKNCRGWVLIKNDTIAGLLFLNFLPWDTEQLGIRCGKLDYFISLNNYATAYKIKNKLLSMALKACYENKIKHLTIRVNANELSSIHVLEKSGFIMVDGILTFSYDLRKTPIKKLATDFIVRLSNDSDIGQIKRIASDSFVYDRFHSDPKISKKVADNLHSVWLENSCKGLAADVVIVGERNKQIIGFVTCKINRQSKSILGIKIGTIVLVATLKEARGKGVASALTIAALNWFKEHQTDIVEVGTQLRNIPAARLYEGIGFKFISSSVSLRKWFKS